MIKYYYKSIRSPKLAETSDLQKGAWVYAEAPTDGEIAQLAKQFKLELGNLEDARDLDEMPRLDREGGHIYMYVRFAYRDSSGNLNTAPLLLILTGEYVITLSQVHLPALDFLLRGRVGFATTQPAKLVLLILSHMSDQYDLYINGTTRQIKSIRARLRGRGITNKDLLDFVTIEDDLNEFQSSLQPTNATLRRLLVGKQLPLFEEDHDIVEDLLLNNEQSMEGIRSNLRSVTNIRDAYSAIASNNLNRTLTILTVATILISVPSLAMGIFSLNIPLPAQHSVWTFWVIQAINVTVMGSVLYIARKKRVI